MPSNPPTLSLILQALLAVACGGTGTAVVTGLLSRRKTKAEVSKTAAETGKTQAEIIGTGANTAATQVDISLDMVREMRVEMTRMGSKIDSLETWKAAHEKRMDAHVRWDEKVWTVLQQRVTDMELDPPPPLRSPD